MKQRSRRRDLVKRRFRSLRDIDTEEWLTGAMSGYGMREGAVLKDELVWSVALTNRFILFREGCWDGLTRAQCPRECGTVLLEHNIQEGLGQCY